MDENLDFKLNTTMVKGVDRYEETKRERDRTRRDFIRSQTTYHSSYTPNLADNHKLSTC